MGKTSKPLRIAVSDSNLLVHPEIVKLIGQGHTIEVLSTQYDLCLGTRCWFMDEPHMDLYLDMAIKAARKRAYGKVEDAD